MATPWWYCFGHPIPQLRSQKIISCVNAVLIFLSQFSIHIFSLNVSECHWPFGHFCHKKKVYSLVTIVIVLVNLLRGIFHHHPGQYPICHEISVLTIPILYITNISCFEERNVEKRVWTPNCYLSIDRHFMAPRLDFTCSPWCLQRLFGGMYQ